MLPPPAGLAGVPPGTKPTLTGGGDETDCPHVSTAPPQELVPQLGVPHPPVGVPQPPVGVPQPSVALPQLDVPPV